MNVSGIDRRRLRCLPARVLAALVLPALVAASCAPPEEQASDTGPDLRYLAQEPPGKAPIVFAPGIVSTDARELNVVFTADGHAVYFTRVLDGRATLFHSRLLDQAWTEPARVRLIAAQPDADIGDPFLSPDGSRLYFVSRARTDAFPEGSTNIWVSEHDGDSWGDASVLPAPVNSEATEFYPAVVADGSLYFSSNREGGFGDYDLYRAQYRDGTFVDAVNLGPAVNSAATEVDAFVSPDERYLVVAAQREGNVGALDLHLSERGADGAWGSLVRMPAINSELTDYCPMVTPDGQYFFFSRRPAEGGDVHWMEAQALLPR